MDPGFRRDDNNFRCVLSACDFVAAFAGLENEFSYAASVTERNNTVILTP